MPIEANGIAHVVFSVRDLNVSAPFYKVLCRELLGMTCVLDDPDGKIYGSPFVYHVGGRTAMGIEQAKHTTVSHNQWNIGIHHYCLRLKSKEDVDEFHRLWLEKLTPLGGSVVQGPKEGTWAPGYYSSLFEDPDHVRIEVNFVPGKGLLGTGEKKLFAKF